MSPDFKYVRHELKDLEIKFARCGEVAWFYCVLDDINTYKGEPASWENARWTGVVEKRDGRWVVVQQHFSFATMTDKQDINMKKGFLILAVFVLLFGLTMAAPVAQAPGRQNSVELPLHTQRFSDRVLFAWVGDYMQTIRVVALSTARGIVVIEANLSRSADVRIRQAIEKEFGRKDFKYLINTHFHHDHVCGNQVYADATVVGHRTVPEGMKGELTGEGLVKHLEMFKSHDPGLGREAEEGGAGFPGLSFLPGGRHPAQDDGRGTPGRASSRRSPSVLFDNSLILDMGDMTVELYSVGGTHTPSDIMIFVPEEGLVAVGDMWPDQVLPYLRKGGPWDLGLILENWGRIVESGREIKHVNIAHSDMRLGVETFKQQYRYLKTLWDGLREMQAEGATLEEAKKKYTIERDFPYFKDRMLKMRDIDIHQNNVEAIWERIGGK